MQTFWAICGLTLVQGAVVAAASRSRLARRDPSTWAFGLRLSPVTALAVGLVLGAGAFGFAVSPLANDYEADLAVAVTIPGAVLAGLVVAGPGRIALAWAVVALGAAALSFPGAPDAPEHLAGLVLVAASAVTVGGALGRLGPAAIASVAVVAIATADVILVATEQVQRASVAIAAAATPSLPQLYEVRLGPVTTGYADFLVGGLAGLALAEGTGRRLVWPLAALLVTGAVEGALLATGTASPVPATVPFAAAVLMRAALRATARGRRGRR